MSLQVRSVCEGGSALTREATARSCRSSHGGLVHHHPIQTGYAAITRLLRTTLPLPFQLRNIASKTLFSASFLPRSTSVTSSSAFCLLLISVADAGVSALHMSVQSSLRGETPPAPAAQPLPLSLCRRSMRVQVAPEGVERDEDAAACGLRAAMQAARMRLLMTLTGATGREGQRTQGAAIRRRWRRRQVDASVVCQLMAQRERQRTQRAAERSERRM
jgi:hypothetical protein